MGLVSLFFIVALTLLYLSKIMEGNKPEFVDKAAGKIRENLDAFSLWALGYGVVAFVLTPVMIRYFGTDMVIRLLANLMIVAMALPHALELVLAKYAGKINNKIAEELRNFVGIVTRHEKIVGYAGAVCAVLLFAVLFR